LSEKLTWNRDKDGVITVYWYPADAPNDPPIPLADIWQRPLRADGRNADAAQTRFADLFCAAPAMAAALAAVVSGISPATDEAREALTAARAALAAARRGASEPEDTP